MAKVKNQKSSRKNTLLILGAIAVIVLVLLAGLLSSRPGENGNTTLPGNETSPNSTLSDESAAIMDAFVSGCVDSAENMSCINTEGISDYCICSYDSIYEKYGIHGFILIYQNETSMSEIAELIEPCMRFITPTLSLTEQRNATIAGNDHSDSLYVYQTALNENQTARFVINITTPNATVNTVVYNSTEYRKLIGTTSNAYIEVYYTAGKNDNARNATFTMVAPASDNYYLVIATFPLFKGQNQTSFEGPVNLTLDVYKSAS